MRKYLLLFLIGISFALPASASPLPLSIPDADTIYYRQGGTLPSFVRFKSPQTFEPAKLGNYLQRLFEQTTPFEFTEIRRETDQLGMTHIRFQQKRESYPIEGAIWIVHLDATGDLLSMGGLLFAPSENAQLPLLNQTQALQQALVAHPAEQYRWEAQLINPPSGQLVWSPPAGNFSSSQLRLAYKFDIYASVPIGRTYTYIDAINGDLLWQENRLQHMDVDSLGIAATAYSGTRKIYTRYNGDRFSLIDLTRGQGIFTLNAREQWYWFMNVEPFYDDNNIWENINLNRDQFATDAHWGTAQTFEYMQQVLGRYSLDNNGYPLVSHVHISKNYRNAFWDGRAMHYGDGDSLGGTVNPLVSIDIVAHETAHGLTQFTAGLIYRSESGALNESYSDIMGKLVQQWSKPESFNWIIGEEASFPIRSMEQPNDFGHPNTYLGNNWSEFERVHTNSGVQNHWFYLLSEGGSGSNDNGDTYQVEGLGYEVAAQIAFRSLFYYLHPSTTYEEARLYSLQAASDLYGACSTESEQVIHAWHAVGVGLAYTTPLAEADFAYSDSLLCSPPFEVQFANLSRYGSAYTWDFGDGASSEEYAPAHTYTSPGQYSVSLRLAGECGSDTKTLNQLISVQAPPSFPNIIHTASNIICGDEVELQAEFTGQAIWYDDSARIASIGERLYLPDFHRSRQYSLKNVQSNQQYRLYPTLIPDTLEEIRNGTQSQNFTVGELVQLHSFNVILAAPSEIKIELYYPDRRRAIGFSMQGSNGENKVELNQYLEPGVSYLLTLSANNLVVVPSEVKTEDNIQGVFELISKPGRGYHFIYDWQVEDFCQSEPAYISLETQVPSPSPIDTTRCGPEKFRFFVPSEGYTVNWYDWQHTLIHQGENFETPTIYGTSRYYVEREDVQTAQNFGPQLDQSLSYPWPEDGFSVIHFRVLEPIIFESFELFADSAAQVVAFLAEQIPEVNAAINDSIEAGRNRISPNWILPAGNYAMRGNSKHIHVQDQGLSFPYEIANLIQIDSISGPAYLPFFDWRVRPASCWSERVPISINRGLQIEPAADFNFAVEGGLVNFENLSKPFDRVLWDFGDGLTSTEIHPQHIYDERASYEVSLQIWLGGCSDFITYSINIEQAEPILQIYPNPATERAYLNIGPLETEEFELSVFDMSGKRILTRSIGELKGRQLAFYALDIANWASGFYVVRLRSAKQQIVRKLQVY